MIIPQINSIQNQIHRKILLRFSEHICNSGVCAYPPLEAHLHEFFQKQKNPVSEPSIPKDDDIQKDNDIPKDDDTLEDTLTQQTECKTKTSTAIFHQEANPDQPITEEKILNSLPKDTTAEKQTLVIGAQYNTLNFVANRGDSESRSPNHSGNQSVLEPDSANTPKQKKPPKLTEVLDQQWQKLPAQVRYEQNLYRLYMQKVMETGDCSYPDLLKSVIQRYEAIHQDRSGCKMRWL